MTGREKGGIGDKKGREREEGREGSGEKEKASAETWSGLVTEMFIYLLQLISNNAYVKTIFYRCADTNIYIYFAAPAGVTELWW